MPITEELLSTADPIALAALMRAAVETLDELQADALPSHLMEEEGAGHFVEVETRDPDGAVTELTLLAQARGDGTMELIPPWPPTTGWEWRVRSPDGSWPSWMPLPTKAEASDRARVSMPEDYLPPG